MNNISIVQTCIGRLGALLSTALMLSGCVAFENPPDVPTGCDTRLVGQWQSDKSSPAKDKMSFVIDAQCRFHDQDDTRKRTKGVPAAFRTLTVGGSDYLAFAPKEFDILLDQPDATSKALLGNQVFLLRYRLNNDLLQVDAIDFDRLDQAMHAKRLNAEELKPEPVILISGTAADTSRILTTQPELFEPTDNGGEKKLRWLFRRVNPATNPPTQ